MNLSESDAAYAANQFIDYFSNMGRIDEYLRNVKLDRMSKMPTYLPGCGPEEDMFDDFDIHPNDMDFKVYAAGNADSFTNEYFNERLQIQRLTRLKVQFLASHSSGLLWKQIQKR